jgi:myo-inositol-1(or 4)-monophosphatase
MIKEEIAFVGIQAALKAGKILKNGFGTSFNVKSKATPLDLVTELDHAAEKAVIGLIREHFPDHAFLGEESGFTIAGKQAEIHTQAPVQWVIDPLDGTMNYVHQIPLFAVSIAALVQDQLQFGVIYQPMTEELFVAQKGQGAYLNGTRLKVSRIDQLQFAVGSTGFPYERAKLDDSTIQQFVKLIDIGNPVRMIGSAALSLAYVAAGRIEAYWGSILSPWDVAAGQLLIEEAGGLLSHQDGSPYQMFMEKSVLASNKLLHQAFVSLLTP